MWNKYKDLCWSLIIYQIHNYYLMVIDNPNADSYNLSSDKIRDPMIPNPIEVQEEVHILDHVDISNLEEEDIQS
jgi:hypothetical protein